MRNLGSGAVAVGLVLALSVASAVEVLAQSGQALKAPRLSLGIASGAPENESELQLKLETPSQLPVGRLDAVVRYPDAALKFERLTGYLVEQGKLAVEVKDEGATEGQRTLVLSVKREGAEASLPSESLATLVFTVAEGAEPGVLDVVLQAKVFQPTGEEISPVEVYPGRINIQEVDVFFGCFFYMH